MISAIIAALGGKLITYALAAVAVAGAFFGLRLSFIRKGVKKEHERQVAHRNKVKGDIDEIEDAVAGRTAEENRAELKKWGR